MCLFGCITEPNLLYNYIKPDQLPQMVTDFEAKVNEIVNLAKNQNSND